ncbi:plasmid stabilization protein ParE [Brachybacterium sp. HMSC06H03]|uniref:type II toxin-antitoxin system RelE/ParE family toxin n=1 Tax=Brachybacterium sp. HMSC06H03 TaxID=1581127 RepID=UPI0008A28733|nr:type II toxin-antitoxin system RelE/ParE family toxin [Brachybacterium sp. HMSC06H03]OFT50713.1 plasmid stabilization protein ParE [Brachybacterium sp. HMSC06H03]
MSTPLFTPAARSDLSSIWDFTAERWDAAQADTYVHELVAAAQRVAVQPERGHPADHIRPGYRRYSIGSHLLFYLVAEGGVTIVRILHQRMDPTRHL